MSNVFRLIASYVSLMVRAHAKLIQVRMCVCTETHWKLDCIV